MPAGKQVYRQTDEGDANADEGADVVLIPDMNNWLA